VSSPRAALYCLWSENRNTFLERILQFSSQIHGDVSFSELSFGVEILELTILLDSSWAASPRNEDDQPEDDEEQLDLADLKKTIIYPWIALWDSDS